MTISHISKVYAVTDAKLSKLLTDPAGGAATYGTALDVPGIKAVKITGTVETKKLRGDNTLLDADSILSDVQVEVENAKISLDVLAAILGGAVVDAGTTPNQTAVWDLTAASKPAPFKLQAVSATADVIGGAVKFDIWKIVLGAFPDLGLAEEDYALTGFKGEAVPLLATGNKWLSTSFFETAPALT